MKNIAKWMMMAAVAAMEAMSADYTYSVTNGNATITKYSGPGGDVTIPETLGGYPVIAIDAMAFYNCGTITGVTTPSNVTSIGRSAFYNCGNLVRADLPGVVAIGNNAFYRCGKLESVELGDQSSVGNYAFAGGGFETVTVPEGGEGRTIGYYAFYQCASLKEAVIEEGVASIGVGAFLGCTSLERISLPSSVTNVGSAAFNDCPRLKTLVIPSNMTGVQIAPFQSISSVDSVEIQLNAQRTALADGLFSGWTNLTRVAIGEGVARIGDRAFLGCVALFDVQLPGSVTNIGDRAFMNCSGLANLALPAEGDMAIGPYAFAGSGISAIVLPRGTTSIGPYAFDGSAIESVSLPDGLSSIGQYAFHGTRLAAVVIPDSVASIGPCAFHSCLNLTSANLPPDLLSVEEYLFYNCPTLGSATIPGSVTNIGKRAFMGCGSLARLEIPGSMARIHTEALRNCHQLAHIYYHGTKTQWDGIRKNGNWRDGVPQDMVIHYLVPEMTATLRWKFSSAVGRYFAQIAVTVYAEELKDLAFLFADRTNSVGDVYAQLWDAAARAPQGVLLTTNGVAYRGVVLESDAFAGRVEGARAHWGVADARFNEPRNIVPAGERQIGLYVRKRVDPVSGNETIAEVENFLGYLTWTTDNTRWFLPVVEGGSSSPSPSGRMSSHSNSNSPLQLSTRTFAPATLNAALALGLGAEAVADNPPKARIADFTVAADGSLSGRVEAVAGGEASSSFGATTVRILAAETPAGPWREVRADVDQATGAFALPAGAVTGHFFRAEVETRTIFE